MDFSRTAPNGKRICPIGFHGTCAACHVQVHRTTPHIHIHWGNSNPEQICGDCYSVIVAASQVTLQALNDFGYDPTSGRAIQALQEQGYFQVLVRIPFDWPGASRN